MLGRLGGQRTVTTGPYEGLDYYTMHRIYTTRALVARFSVRVTPHQMNILVFHLDTPAAHKGQAGIEAEKRSQTGSRLEAFGESIIKTLNSYDGSHNVLRSFEKVTGGDRYRMQEFRTSGRVLAGFC